MPAQIIIVDDDPIVGTLTLELLQDAGFTVSLIQDSLRAQAEIKKEKPALVILDILMPGLNGLALLHKLKSDPETKDIRAIVVSGKSFAADKSRALQYGAELFIEKPYDVDSFAKTVSELLHPAKNGTAAEEMPSAPPAAQPARPTLTLEVWGCRSGSSAPAGTGSRRRTCCVSVDLSGRLFVFDAGSGIATLGDKLVKEGTRKELWLFLTHFHRDHVEGLADFACVNDPGYTIHISAASDPDKPLERAAEEVFAPRFGDQMPPARIDLYELREETYEIMPGVHLTAFYANHPDTTLGFALQTDGRRIVYCPDSEIYGEAATALQDYDEKLGGICRDADVLFHDGCYTEEDYQNNRNKGHSSFLAAVDFAGRNRVKRLVLVHQDERYTDFALEEMASAAQARVKEKGYDLVVEVGREGMAVTA